jgi:uncharacterized protein YjlB
MMKETTATKENISFKKMVTAKRWKQHQVSLLMSNHHYHSISKPLQLIIKKT